MSAPGRTSLARRAPILRGAAGAIFSIVWLCRPCNEPFKGSNQLHRLALHIVVNYQKSQDQ